MPTVIDHAIAIPARPQYVWDVIRDIPLNPTWQLNSERVQFLTSVKQGRGTRWRNTTPDNKEQVFEITAWYEGLGYEYRIVDGSPYPKNRGRIRLQEAPEGTVVQWTFTYEVDGFLGSIRNSIGMRGSADKQVIEGLRKLYAFVKDVRNDEMYDPEASKAFLREAPNVVERSEYQPRHPSKLKDQDIDRVDVTATQEQDALFRPPAPTMQTQTTPAPIINEPPIAEDDTRPNPAVSPAAEVDAPPAETSFAPPSEPTAPPTPVERLRETRQTSDLPPLEEPDFLKAMPDALPMEPVADSESATYSDAPPTPIEESVAPVPEPSAPIEPMTADEQASPVSEPSAPIEPTVIDEETSELEAETTSAEPLNEPPVTEAMPPTMPVAPETDATITKPSKPTLDDVTPDADAVTKDDVLAGAQPAADFKPVVDSSTDTSQMSIFEIFGVAKPSESQQVKTITPEQEAEARSTAASDSDILEYEPLKPLTPEEEEKGRASFMNSTPIIPDIQPRLPERRRGLRATLRRTMRVPDSD